MTGFVRIVGAMSGLLLLVLIAGCGSTTGPAGSGHHRLNIVTAFYPFQFIAQRVAGSHADVSSLTKPGAEPHDLELTPRQVAGITDADLVIYEKTFQAAVDEAVAQSGNSNVLDTTTAAPLEDHGPLGDEEDHHDQAGSTNLDPHVWLDPERMITITKAVTKRLDGIDPDDRADYDKNSAALVDQLSQLSRSYKSGLSACQRTDFITSHAAFGYLAERYGLTQISISGLSPDTEPSPARIAQVQQLAKQHGVTTIFYETLISPAVARSVAGDLGLKTDVLDPIEGITDQSRGKDYLAVMKSNLTALRQANGCQ